MSGDHDGRGAAVRAAQDLVWFYTEAEGDMGLKSSFGAMVAMLEKGTPCGGRPVMEFDERCIDAAERERPIRRALEAIGPEQARVLRLAFVDERRVGLEAFGDCAALVLVSPRARRAWEESSTSRSMGDWLRRISRRIVHETSPNLARDRMLVIEIMADAKLQLEFALARYCAARHRGPRR